MAVSRVEEGCDGVEVTDSAGRDGSEVFGEDQTHLGTGGADSTVLNGVVDDGHRVEHLEEEEDVRASEGLVDSGFR